MVDFEIVIRAANAIMNGCGESGKCRGGEEELVALIFFVFLAGLCGSLLLLLLWCSYPYRHFVLNHRCADVVGIGIVVVDNNTRHVDVKASCK